MMNMRHPSVLAAYAGRNDGTFCKNIGDLGVGMVTIGGISVDEAAKKQSEKLIARKRAEFVFQDHEAFIQEQVAIAKESGAKVAVNIRSSTVEGYLNSASVIADCGAVVEIDAHCRQEEIVGVGAGQALLYDLPRLHEILVGIKDIGVSAILKFRGNVVPEVEIYDASEGCCDALHVDAMLKGFDEFDTSVFNTIPDGIFLIGNNSIRDAHSARIVLEYCDAFSFARVADDMDAVRNIVEGI